jgi:hypothetical protein
MLPTKERETNAKESRQAEQSERSEEVSVSVLQNFTAEMTANLVLICLRMAGWAALILPRWVAVALLDRVSGFF